MRYFLSILCFFWSFSSSCMYESPKRRWEIDYKASHVLGYSEEDLVAHFQDLRISQNGPVPVHITLALREIVRIPVGKELVSDIIARIEPQLLFVNSLEAILDEIREGKDNPLVCEQVARLSFGLMDFLEPGSVGVKQNVINFLQNLDRILTSRFEECPSRIDVRMYEGDLFTEDFIRLVNGIYLQFEGAFRLIKDDLLGVCFRFGDRADSYDPVTRTISVEDCVVRLSKVTGPVLCTAGVPVGVIASDRDCLIDERLFHEILHYDHLTLRKEEFDDISLIGRLLIVNGFNHAYVGVLSSLWTNAEEFRTITGLFSRDGNMRCFKQSEYRYLSEKGSGLRYGHSPCYCSKVPVYFLNLLRNYGIDVHLEDDRERDYIKQNDDV